MVIGPINSVSAQPAQADAALTASSGSTPAQALPVASEATALPPVQEQAVQADSGEARNDLEDVVSNINDFVQSIQRNLQFSVSEDGSRTIITVINPETQEVIRQIPPEEVVAISEAIRDQLQNGILFNAEA